MPPSGRHLLIAARLDKDKRNQYDGQERRTFFGISFKFWHFLFVQKCLAIHPSHFIIQIEDLATAVTLEMPWVLSIHLI